MEFTSHTQEATFYSPLEEFAEVTERVEVREDPLTGRTSRLTGGAFVMPDEYDIESFVGDGEGCFFCPGTVEAATPEYPDWVGFDRGSRGEATSFPNLNPYSTYSNVVALTETHFQPMEQFTTTQFADGLGAALDYLHAVADHDETVTQASVNMNFLRSAGSSIVHPHMQAVADDRGTTEGRTLLEASRTYHDDHGTTYWDDLVDAERDGERFIDDVGPVSWLAPWAPRHHRHVQAVAGSERDGFLPDPDGAVVEGLAEGLTAVLASYAEAGLNAFNVALHLADDPAMPPVMDVVARSVFDEYYWSDATFFTTLHDEGVIGTAPEAYAAEVRAVRGD